MEALILGWYVLVETGSVVLLTLFGSMLYIGTLIAPMLGVIGDRIGQRYLLVSMRTAYTVLAATLMALAFTGLVNPFYVFIIAALQGIVRPSDLGVRAALTTATMPPDQLVGALSISRTTSDSARIMGALAGAGLFVAFGMGPAYVAVTCFYALGALLTLGVARDASQHPHAAAPSPMPASPWRDLREGITHVWTTQRLLALMWIAFLVNLTAFPFVNGLMPYIAKEVYLTDQAGLGYLVASLSSGALVGSIALSALGNTMRLERMIIVATVAWYVLLFAFAQMEAMLGGVIFLMLAGFAQSLTMVSLAVILMRTSSPRFRGRVMGVRMLAIYSLPLGLLAAGLLIERIGYNATASIYAAVGLVFTVIIAVRWRDDLWRCSA
jgi:predicted MFS family arabinose efflux permease